MKKLTLIGLFILALTMSSCNQKTKKDPIMNTEITTIDSTVITSDQVDLNQDSTIQLNDTQVVNKQVKKTTMNKIYSCPMHPEVQGKLNSKCSKCGMPLTEPVL
jgi:hypothetical protein